MPSESEAQIARESRRILASLVKSKDGTEQYRLSREGNTETEIALPPAAVRVLMGVLEELGKGNAVTVVPVQSELTTQQAADLVAVSRPFFIKLLDEGKIPYRKVGSHRRVLYQDVLRYLEQEEARSEKVMQELIAETERLGLYQ